MFVGRAEELACVRSFLAEERGAPGLVLTGAAGVGKTTVWEAAVEAAAAEGWRVLRARPAESEAQLSFVAVNDLLYGVDVSALDGVPEPQRHALDVVLSRVAPGERSAEPSAASLGFANVLRVLAAERRLLVAIDDVPWLDRPSAEMLAFVARRVQDGSVRFVLARRVGPESSLERAFEARALRQLELSGLSLGAMRVLLAERLKLRPARRMLRRLWDTTEGNPLLTLELARALKAQTAGLEVAELASVIDVSREPFVDRVAALTSSLRQAVLAVVLNPQMTRRELEAICGCHLVQDAVSQELLADFGERVRLVHPLLGAAVSRRATPAERRVVHGAIACVLVDESRAILHAALATTGYDPDLATRAAAAAADALERGAVYDAVELGQHALRLTDAGSPEHAQRLLGLGRYLVIAGELPAVSELLAPWVEKLPAGRPRAQAHLLLGEAAPLAEHERHLDLALEHSRHDPDVRADALSAKSILLALIRVADIRRAEALAEQALATGGCGPETMQRALHALAWARALRGRPSDGMARAGTRPPGPASLYESALVRPAAVRLTWRGQVAEARTMLRRLLDLSEQRGEARSCVVLTLHLCELELRVGDARAAAKLLDDWEDWTAGEAVGDIETIRARCEALLAAIRGRTAEVAHWAQTAIASSQSSGFAWDRLDALRAVGLAALHDHAPQRAVDPLRAVWEHVCREQVLDPGAFPVGSDLVEALYSVSEAAEAEAVRRALAEAARAQRHPWAGAAVARCRAETSLARRRNDEALERFQVAAAAYRDLGLHFDCARALLSAGGVARSIRRWGTARRLLEDAAAGFSALGSDGWADEARAQVDRTGARKPRTANELTSSERRVATFAAAGLSNKEIAERLVISTSTVETHLKRCYAKLGVRSRTQLGPSVAAIDSASEAKDPGHQVLSARPPGS